MEQPQKETVKQIFAKYLKERSLRQTSVRYDILDRIYSIEGLFDVEKLYISMKKHEHKVSRATLYNTLDLLVECNLVIKHQLGKNNISTFEKAHATRFHHYLVCTVCEKVREFSDVNIKHAVQAKKIKNFNISHYSLYVYGTCVKCKKGK